MSTSCPPTDADIRLGRPRGRTLCRWNQGETAKVLRNDRQRRLEQAVRRPVRRAAPCRCRAPSRGQCRRPSTAGADVARGGRLRQDQGALQRRRAAPGRQFPLGARLSIERRMVVLDRVRRSGARAVEDGARGSQRPAATRSQAGSRQRLLAVRRLPAGSTGRASAACRIASFGHWRGAIPEPIGATMNRDPSDPCSLRSRSVIRDHACMKDSSIPGRSLQRYSTAKPGPGFATVGPNVQILAGRVGGEWSQGVAR